MAYLINSKSIEILWDSFIIHEEFYLGNLGTILIGFDLNAIIQLQSIIYLKV